MNTHKSQFRHYEPKKSYVYLRIVVNSDCDCIRLCVIFGSIDTHTGSVFDIDDMIVCYRQDVHMLSLIKLHSC